MPENWNLINCCNLHKKARIMRGGRKSSQQGSTYKIIQASNKTQEDDFTNVLFIIQHSYFFGASFIISWQQANNFPSN